MEVRRCMRCMHELAADQKFCPECGRPYGSVNTESFALKPGTILDGKYLVGEMLGQGGFGITYIGFDLLLEQKVAIKEYFPMSTGMVSRENRSMVVWSTAMMGKTGTQKGFDSFLKEARKMAKLGGIPGVVGVKSVFIQNETAYIVMDFIEGETLLKKLQREGPMPFDTCLSLLMPIIQALAEVHEHGIIHRDISPDNIMVRPDGRLILLDLGAAKDLDIQGRDGNVQSSQMVAKQGFSPIEQYQRNASIGPWTDVYAMAATIYYCCTGILPPTAVDRIVDDTLTCQPLLTQAQFDVLAYCIFIVSSTFMKTKFRWNAMQVSLATIFFWAWFIGMMFRYNWVYYLLVTVLLVGCVGFYVRQYLRDKKQSEQFLENATYSPLGT